VGVFDTKSRRPLADNVPIAKANDRLRGGNSTAGPAGVGGFIYIFLSPPI
jgi:hypothetical protein